MLTRQNLNEPCNRRSSSRGASCCQQRGPLRCRHPPGCTGSYQRIGSGRDTTQQVAYSITRCTTLADLMSNSSRMSLLRCCAKLLCGMTVVLWMWQWLCTQRQSTALTFFFIILRVKSYMDGSHERKQPKKGQGSGLRQCKRRNVSRADTAASTLC